MTNDSGDGLVANLEFEILDDLLLDPENPRLPKHVERTQHSMLSYIARNTSIEELMEVIGQNGFFSGEPLIVIPDGEKYVVVEGNRRLTAVRLLCDPEAAPGERRRKIRDVAENAMHRPKRLPVVKRNSREEVLTYLGYRHITGVKQWEPLAKARYMEQLYAHTDSDLSVTDRVKIVAREIGSRSNHIKRYLNALAVYDEIEESEYQDLDSITESNINFSLLSTALGYSNILNFVGTEARLVENNWETEVGPEGFIGDRSKIDTENLNDLAKWIFVKGDSGKPWVPESRDIRKLASVVANEGALASAHNSATLDQAYQKTVSVTDDFMSYLYQAQDNLDQAMSLCSHARSSQDAIDLAEGNMKTARNIHRLLKSPEDD